MSKKKKCGRKRYWKQVRKIATSQNISIREARKVWRETNKQGKAPKGLPKKERLTMKNAVAVKNLGCLKHNPGGFSEAAKADLVRLHGENILGMCTCLGDHTQAPKKAGVALNIICPYCRDDLYSTDELHTCDVCNTSCHAECAAELRVPCSTLGCRGLIADSNTSATAERQVVVIGPDIITFRGRVLQHISPRMRRAWFEILMVLLSTLIMIFVVFYNILQVAE